MRWRIEFFGGSRFVGETGTIDHFRTQKSVLLLARLASYPPRLHSRDALCELLWPDEESEKQRNRLRYELSTLRKATWGGLFHTPDNSLIALAESVSGDVAAFEEAVRTGTRMTTPRERVPYLEAAVALYKGDFLPGFYDDWVIAERDRLRELYGDALTRLFVNLDHLGSRAAARQVRDDCVLLFADRVIPALRAAEYDADPGAAADSARRFHGRDRELASARAWVAGDGRLLTITGMGGIGKTRLAKEAGRGGAAPILHSPLPVIALAAVFESEALLEAIALALPEADAEVTSPSVADTIIARLAALKVPTLLVFDNFEQIRGGSGTLENLLAQCPNLRCLVTSQAPLAIPGETLLALSPLPPVNALALFLDRARAARPDFAPESDAGSGGSTVGAICELLEGVPLALELAAARVATLGTGEILSQLTRQPGFLAADAPADRGHRHGSLRAALEWTAGLLEPALRERLGALSVFSGGFTLDALRAAVPGVPDAELLDSVSELRRYSLLTTRITAEPGSDAEGTRWQFLEIVREFAGTLLAPPARMTYRRRHAAYFAETGNRVGERVAKGEWGAARAWVERERANTRSAVTFAAGERDAELLFQFSGLFARLLFENGYWSDCDYLLGEAEATLGGTPGAAGRHGDILGLRGAMARRRGREEDAQRLWEQRFRLQEQHPEAGAPLDTLCDLAGQAVDRQQWAKGDDYIRSADALAGGGKEAVVIRVLRARLAAGRGDEGDAIRHADAAQAEHSLADDAYHVRLYRDYYLAPIYRQFGRTEAALTLLLDALRLAREGRDPFYAARFCAELADIWNEAGIPGKAGIALYTAHKIHAELQSRLMARSLSRWLQFRQRAADSPSLTSLIDGLSGLTWDAALPLLWEEDL